EALEPFRALGPVAVDAAIRKADALARRDGPDAMLGACARAVPADARRAAYGMAADLVAADREFGDMEHRFLLRLREFLDLDEATAAAILETSSVDR
ncbi:MAG TPA: hypothetical protein VI997_00670, partial [Candidatus Thermoplasmatota archaeon]|nr:hypothetical protein [Candidatus Thermoplasmatota archaeon]